MMQSLVPATTAAIAATAAVVTTTATVAATETTAAARRTLFTRTCLVYADVTTTNIFAVEGIDSSVRFIVVRHFYKAEAFATVRHLVGYNLARRYFAVRFKELLEVCFRCTPAEVTNVQIHKKNFKNHPCSKLLTGHR